MNKKVAVVYDWIDKWGGVERVLLTLKEMFPRSTFFTSVYDREKARWAKDISIKTSFLDSFPRFVKSSRILSLPFYPLVFESFDFKDFDLVISVTSGFAKSVVTHPATRHICYLLTPTRYLWSHEKKYFKSNIFVGPLVSQLKNWDRVVAHRPDEIISISKTVKERCKKYYGLDSKVLYPPFDTEHWSGVKSKIKEGPKKVGDEYFLLVSRLETYKNIDLVVRTFNNLEERLIIVGEGTEEKKLKRLAGKNITFLSNISDLELGKLYRDAKALIMPQIEDFGYVSLEAQFFGTPVIANKRGGASETVEDGQTGIFFDGEKEKSLRQAIARFNEIGYNLKANVKRMGEARVSRFDKKLFIKEFKKYL